MKFSLLIVAAVMITNVEAIKLQAKFSKGAYESEKSKAMSYAKDKEAEAKKDFDSVNAKVSSGDYSGAVREAKSDLDHIKKDGSEAEKESEEAIEKVEAWNWSVC